MFWNDSLRRTTPAFARTALGTAVAAGTGYASARVFARTDVMGILPLIFIGVLYALSWRYGLGVAVLGSLACAFIFAHFLFKPLGSWRVEDFVARRNLLWMVVGAISLSYLFVPSRSQDRP
jgi:K+-sensing histidine kinase KdpD